ncbi:unnamed protein product [Penicillium salamii]|uniref:Cell surface protein n=1 Tax=Penicillium salamii TaxID=1612424 RepID=A0A9W4JSW0_9EURO|nr:unnamed protein product [Penicillium salamii]CAG8064163.1 unnamed protein product [Penicillium salamii]CAG8266624.1 unnamed protein product [Penicillium salamii]CAG8408725.1 unnamed protein product [Penicillium salamii]CAG8411290.1 unnamed protein product [Penicillium salamii]
MQFVRKAEEALTGKKDDSHESTQSSNHGPHSSNLANKLDPRVDSDRDNRAVHTEVDDKHLSTAKDYGSGTAGATTADTHGLGDTGHGSTLGSTTHGTTKSVADTGATTYGSSSSNAGPHSSNIANKADPRVDSDRDHRGRRETFTNLGATTGTTHDTSTNAGPHDSNAANKLDPRVDSDRDNRALLSGADNTPALGSTHGSHGPSSTLGSNTHPLASTGTASQSTNLRPHDSDLANKLDPRVDSDLDARTTHQSLSGIGTGTVTHGSHSRDTASGLAPGQGLAGSSYNTPTGTATGTSGTTATAGPHDSSVANKLDPTVKSQVPADSAQREI